MSTPTDLGVVVVSSGYPDLLERNLVGLARRMPKMLVVVVDNFSGLAQRDATTALCAREGWALLAPGLDLGFGAAVNAGVRLLRARGCRLLLILDPAVRIDESAVRALARECAEDPQRILSPRIDHSNGTVWFGGGTVDIRRGRNQTNGSADSAAPDGWLTGACMMIHAGLWEWLHGFDETFFVHWGDVDLSWRCVAAGGCLAVRHDISAVRNDGAGQAGVGATPLQIYSACRNRLAFASRHLDRWSVFHWLLSGPGYAAFVLRRPERDATVRPPIPLVAAAMRGTVAGAAIALGALARPSSTSRAQQRASAASPSAR